MVNCSKCGDFRPKASYKRGLHPNGIAGQLLNFFAGWGQSSVLPAASSRRTVQTALLGELVVERAVKFLDDGEVRRGLAEVEGRSDGARGFSRASPNR